MASMTSTVSSNKSMDVEDTVFGMGLDSSGGTIWDFAEVASDTSSGSKSLATTAVSKSSSSVTRESSSSSSYNPQEEIVWKHCANNKADCIPYNFISGGTQVRYGTEQAGGKWTYKYVSNPKKCNNDNFGDPHPEGYTKSCQYLVPPSYAPKWEYCANEGQTCKVGSGLKAVRYGRNKHWRSKNVSGNVNCNDATFGDPINGKSKTCEIMSIASSSPLDYEWVYCGGAKHEDICTVGSSAVVRLGTDNGKTGDFYSYRFVRDSIKCKNSNFGDPIDDTSGKECWYLRYIDPADRQDQTNLTWSTKETSINLDTSQATVTEVAGDEQALVEIEFSESMGFTYYGIRFEAKIVVAGEAGLKSSAFVDAKNKTFTLTGGPWIDVDTTAKGSANAYEGLAEVGIKAPLAVLDMYSPFTIALTVKPGVLTAEISLDYFLDLLAGEVILYYKYDYIVGSDNDELVVYSWDYLYQTTENIFYGKQEWEFSTPITDYALPAIPDGFYEQKLSFPSPIEGREYFLELAGTLQNSEVWDTDNPNESVIIDIVCASAIVESLVFSGDIRETIPLGDCTEVIISGIRGLEWPEGNGMSFGLREQ